MKVGVRAGAFPFGQVAGPAGPAPRSVLLILMAYHGPLGHCSVRCQQAHLLSALHPGPGSGGLEGVKPGSVGIEEELPAG